MRVSAGSNMSRWIRLAHFDELNPKIQFNAYVEPTTPAGKVGDTGHAFGPHVHVDGTWEKPASWFQYVAGWSKERIKKLYFNTQPFWSLILPYKQMYVTSEWLEWDGSVFHPGGDLNVRPEDRGLDAYCGVYGRVQFVAKSSVVRKLMTQIFRLKLNGGFGNFFWIEIDESKYKKV